MGQYWDPVPAVLSHVYAEPLSGIDLLGYLLYFTHYTDHRPDSPTHGWAFPAQTTIKDAMHIGAATLARLDTIASAFALVERRTTRHHTLRRILPPLDPDTLLQHLDQGLLPIIPKNAPMPTRLMLQAAAARLRTSLLDRRRKTSDPQESEAGPAPQEAATQDVRTEPPAPLVQPEPPVPQESATIPPAPRPTAPSVPPREAPTAPRETRPATHTKARTQTPVVTHAPRPAPRIPTEPPAPAVQAPQTTPREAPAVASTPAGAGPSQDVSRPSQTAIRPSQTAIRPSQDPKIGPSWDPKYPNELKYPNPNPANPITAPGGGGEALPLLGQIRALGQRLGVEASGLCSALGRCLAGPDLPYVIEHLPEELRPGWRQRARDPLAYLIGVGRRLVAQRTAETLLDALPPEPAAEEAGPVAPEAEPPAAEPVDTDAPSAPPPGCPASRWTAFLAAARAHLGLRHTPPILAVLPWRVEGGELRPVVVGTFAEQYAARHTALLAALAEVWRAA